MVTGNAFLGGKIGVGIGSVNNFTGTVEKNTFEGHHLCGVLNKSGAAVAMPDNYWGAIGGPGPAPADQVGGSCEGLGSTTTVTPFATKPFNVKAVIKP